MASRCFTFATLADYQNARAENIKNILNSAEAAPSITCISTVSGTGEVFIDSMNTIVPRNKGAIGDLLVYKNSTYYWVKTTNAFPDHTNYVSAPISDTSINSTMTSTVSYGGCMYRPDKLTAAGYTIIGYMGYKEGDRCLILSLVDLGSKTWASTTSELVSDCFNDTSIGSMRGYIGNITSCSQWYAYKYAKHRTGENQRYKYTYPIAEGFWNEVHKKYLAGQNASNATITGYDPNHMKYTIAFPNVTIYGCNTEYRDASGNVPATFRSVNPLSYNWNFDAYYRNEILFNRHGSYAGSDMNGVKNTRAIINKHGANAPAAYAAYNYSISGVTDFGAGQWWLPSCGELCRIFENGEILDKAYCIPWGQSYYWASSQHTAARSWYCRADSGNCLDSPRTDTRRVRPCSAFVLNP